jgi:hypothetical protein
MAEIYIRCPSIGCAQVLTVPSETRGLLVTCRFCKRMIRIPVERRDPRPAVGTVGKATLTAAATTAGTPAVPPARER